MRIGFIGLGRMGSGMARNLLRAGYEVTVYNRTREKAEALASDGARVAPSPAAVSAGAEAVFTMLSDDDAVLDVAFGENGFATTLQPNAAHISCSTISARLARDLARRHAESSQGYISAPVFGRPEAAESKKLVVIAAGPKNLVARFRPLLDALGRETLVAGSEPWQANAVKLCGNFMIAAMMEAFGEAYAALRKAQVDPALFRQAMDALFASPVYANYGRIIAEERFEPAGFALKLGLKDMRLALENARECAAPMPLGSLVHDRLLAALAQGQADMDWSAMTRIAAREAGL